MSYMLFSLLCVTLRSPCAFYADSPWVRFQWPHVCGCGDSPQGWAGLAVTQRDRAMGRERGWPEGALRRLPPSPGPGSNSPFSASLPCLSFMFPSLHSTLVYCCVAPPPIGCDAHGSPQEPPWLPPTGVSVPSPAAPSPFPLWSSSPVGGRLGGGGGLGAARG